MNKILTSLRALFFDDIGPHLKRYSVWSLGALGTLQTAWLALPDAIKQGLPATAVTALSTLLAVGGLIGAFMKQGESNGGN